MMIMLVLSLGAMGEVSPGDREHPGTNAPLAAPVNGAQETTAPSVLAPEDSSPGIQSRREQKPNRWKPTLEGAGKGLSIGALISVVGFAGWIGVVMQGPDAFGLRGLLIGFGAVVAVGFTAASTVVGSIVGYRQTEAAARRYEGQGSPSLRGPVSRYSFWQIPVLAGVFLHAFVSGNTWMADHHSTAPAFSQEAFDSQWRPRPIDFGSRDSGRANVALLAYSTLSAFLFHYVRPIGQDGKRQSSWGQAGLLAAGSLVAGLSVPMANRIRHGAAGKVSQTDHGAIWGRANIAAIIGLLVTDWVLSKPSGPGAP